MHYWLIKKAAMTSPNMTFVFKDYKSKGTNRYDRFSWTYCTEDLEASHLIPNKNQEELYITLMHTTKKFKTM